MFIKNLITITLLAFSSFFLGTTARAEVVSIDWSGSLGYVADIPSQQDSRSLTAMGISANWPPGSGGTPFAVSFSYDSTTTSFYSSSDGVNSEAYFQGISCNISVDGKLVLQTTAPIFRIGEGSDSWSLMPFYGIYPDQFSSVYFNDSLTNQTQWRLNSINFGVSNSDHATNAYNGIGLLYNQLPTASQFTQIANEIVRSDSTWDPIQNAFATLSGAGEFSPEYFGSLGFSSSGAGSFAVAPEPSALSLLAVGLGGLAMIRRRRS